MTDIDVRWAWSQVEAAADGSLSADEMRRMRRAMARASELRAAVDRAKRLRADLRSLGRTPVPRSLTKRLLAIPRDAGHRSAQPREAGPGWSWATAAGAAAVTAFAIFLAAQPPQQDDGYDERTAALQDFQVAMGYLQRSYEMAGQHVRRTMERELVEAIWLRFGREDDAGDRETNGG